MDTTFDDHWTGMLITAYRAGVGEPARHGSYGLYRVSDETLWAFVTQAPPHIVADLERLPGTGRSRLLTALRIAYQAGQLVFPEVGAKQHLREIPGTVWLLKHTYRRWSGGDLWTDVHPFTDPGTAIAYLARWARRQWALKQMHPLVAQQVSRMPVSPPADDPAVVAHYFRHTLPADQPGHDWYELTCQAVNPLLGPEPLGGWALTNAGDVTCPCGNAADGEGLECCEQDGTVTGGQGSCDFLVCLTCFRHIDADTGRVVGVLNRDRVLEQLAAHC